MKKITVLSGFLGLLSIASARADGNGIINFTGAVTSQTCNATVNGATGATAASVILPTVQSGVLASAGNTAGQTAFNVDVTGCEATSPAGAGTVKAYFEQGPNVDSNGRLINTASGGAQNVSLELVDGTGNTAIRAGDISQNTDNFVAISGGGATVPYAVRYYATGASTAGAVTSSVTYSLIYK